MWFVLISTASIYQSGRIDQCCGLFLVRAMTFGRLEAQTFGTVEQERFSIHALIIGLIVIIVGKESLKLRAFETPIAHIRV